MKYNVLLKWLFWFFLMSCTPLRRIDMINHSSHEVEITWTLKEMDSLYKNPFFMSNSTTVKFELTPARPYNEVKMSFGSGSWPPLELKSVTNRLESLEIKYAKGTIQLDSSEAIYSFLLNRRKGIGKRKIEILIKD
jgi:hypothetical protein